MTPRSFLRIAVLLGASACFAGCSLLSPDKSTSRPRNGSTANLPKNGGSARAAPILPAMYLDAEAHSVLQRLLPARVSDAGGWAGDIVSVMTELDVRLSPDNLCSVLAVIEQESDYDADPAVPNLPQLVMREVEARRVRYNIPQFVLDAGLDRASADGRSYRQRVAVLRTESDVSRLYEEINESLPDIARRYQPSNPVGSGGAMQVNIVFAEDYARQQRGASAAAKVRRDVFTRRGGLYYGVAMLLAYNAPYPESRYRFADYNAGRYTSRNAAFQMALSRISGVSLAADGDLLIYAGGKPSEQASQTQRTAEAMSVRLGLSVSQIQRDLRAEKSEEFIYSQLWQKVFAQADALAGSPVPRVVMPVIAVQSPKFKRTLTTSGYAAQVDGRWKGCMSRQLALMQ